MTQNEPCQKFNLINPQRYSRLVSTGSFTTTATRIADQAEFTPRNVLTAEGPATTVFAIKLAVQNADGNLKSGMPADDYFEQ